MNAGERHPHPPAASAEPEIDAPVGNARRVGLFGGSFDPIHAGHLLPVADARARLGLDRVIYLPTARPPHKPKRCLAPAWARYAMVELALLSEEGLYASPHELTLGRPAFTVETVEAFRRRWPEVALSLLVGSDSFAELDTWHRWQELVAAVRLVVLARPGWEVEQVIDRVPAALARRVEAGEVDVVATRPVDLSATDVRQILARGEEPPPGALAAPVLHYIRKYSLYR
ncbi:MAG TPA: nicotinate (nicotinamide) nucleotide adenylyltransferase [Thermoanaerobaculia bacterium]